jgi:hypothetical protein
LRQTAEKETNRGHRDKLRSKRQTADTEANLGKRDKLRTPRLTADTEANRGQRFKPGQPADKETNSGHRGKPRTRAQFEVFAKYLGEIEAILNTVLELVILWHEKLYENKRESKDLVTKFCKL